MKRSEINRGYKEAAAFLKVSGWHLPPEPRWDLTDFSLGDFRRYGLTCINLAEEPEYCEKLMYAKRGQETPAHAHKLKKEDIICRTGALALRVWECSPEEKPTGSFDLKVNGVVRSVESGSEIVLNAGERITLVPGVYHAFWAESEECIIGEVSTANDDLNDNFFVDPNIGRFSEIEEDEPALVRLVSE